MDTATAAAPITESVNLDGDYYVAHGLQGQMFRGTCEEWADTFLALGGISAGVTPGWRHGTDFMVAEVIGSPESITFVLNNL